ncbi:MAG: hypothetical protein QOE11_3654 [Solirubrobacteraceae bacterium]|nr:hypothetical protein [Solirubrobacteraceae bacterium]
MVAPVPAGSGGLGRAAGDFADGLTDLGLATEYVGAQPRSIPSRLAASRLVRRASAGPQRLCQARDVRRVAAAMQWDVAYAVAGSAPVGRSNGIVVLHQSTHHPSREFELVRRGRAETGGRGDLSRTELRRRLREVAEADLIHVTTEIVRDEFLEAGVAADRLVFVPLGVDLEQFAPAPKSGELHVAFVGPMSMRKGVDVVAALAERLGDTATVTAVGGPICNWSRQVFEAARFEMRGSVQELFAEAQVFVLPSRSDAFSYAVLEAMAAGVVPIVTPEVGASEIVRRIDSRLVIERAEFVDRVAELLPMLELARLSREARALAMEYDRAAMTRAAASAVVAAATRLAA